MAGFSTTLKRNRDLTPDVRLALKSTHGRASVVWRQAVRVFVETLADEVSKHQDTGMSYGSLFTLARLVKAKLPPPTINTKERKGMKTITGTYYPNRYRDLQAGIRLGEKSGRISYGNASNPRYSFIFEIKVYQYLINEFGLGFSKSAWESIGRATEAMNDFLRIKAPFFVPSISDLFRETARGERGGVINI